jgi:hypothetical protein
MRRTRKLFLISLGCAVIVMFLLMTAVLIAHLMANRESVRDSVVSLTARATGGTLDYARLEVALLPLPHLEVTRVSLERDGVFSLKARRLSAYPAILPALAGRIRIRRLMLDAPDVRLFSRSSAGRVPEGTAATESGGIPVRLDNLLAAPFGMLGAITPGTRWRIRNGSIALVMKDAPDIRSDAINAVIANHDGRLEMHLAAASTLAASCELEASVDLDATRASGHLDLTGLNLRPLLFYASLPMGIVVGDTNARLTADLNVDSRDRAAVRFNLAMPQLTVTRSGRQLTLQEPVVNGALRYGDGELTLAVDRITTRGPALDLTAAATLANDATSGQTRLAFNAGAAYLDIAVAADVTRAIAGDRRSIRTAFDVVRAGRLENAAFTAGLTHDGGGWALAPMAASGQLQNGRITIPGIGTDLEGLNGEVAWKDHHVDFKSVHGGFKGIRVDDLTASIDWANEARLTLDTRSAQVDAAVFYPWLTGIAGLSGLKQTVGSIDGTATLSRLTLDGPLKHPRQWSLAVVGSPETLRLTSPRLPFPVSLDKGEISYSPVEEQSRDVNVRFLDGTVTVSHHSRGFTPLTSLTCRLDGEVGPRATDWLGTVLPIPAHLLVKPPVILKNIELSWDGHTSLAVTGGLETASGVHLDADAAFSADAWQIKTLHFADDRSAATLSARRTSAALEVAFSGNVVKETIDNLLDANRTLSGRIAGDFKSRIDIAAPLRSTFTGTVSGNGLHLHPRTMAPVDVHRFEVAGSGSKVTIAPSQLAAGDSLATVSGTIQNTSGTPTFDLRVDADRLDAALLKRLFAAPDEGGTPAAQPATADAPPAPPPASPTPRGTIHLQADQFHIGDFTWSPLSAEAVADGRSIHVQVGQAALCGISTTGWIKFSPEGTSLHIVPSASGVSLQETTDCLLSNPPTARAAFDLTGDIRLPPTTDDTIRALTGQLQVSSKNGRIVYSSVLMKIFSVLNVTEVFTGGKTDLAEEGYGYTRAFARAAIDGGVVRLEELLLDGNSLKITGQGEIDMVDRQMDVTLLAAPLKTVDRIVDKIPIVSYITGGTLVSVPMRVHGDIANPSVVPLAPSAVGRGLVGIMGRVLKAPFKLVQSAAGLVSGTADAPPATSDSPAPETPQP